MLEAIALRNKEKRKGRNPGKLQALDLVQKIRLREVIREVDFSLHGCVGEVSAP